MGRVDPSKIEQFLRDASPIARTSFEDRTLRKRELLRQYFGRFQEGASQDLDRYSPMQIGAIFSRVYSGYRKRTG